MTAARYVALRCDGPGDGPGCYAETNHGFSDGMTITGLRKARREDGWHARPGGRDICPGCWERGHR